MYLAYLPPVYKYDEYTLIPNQFETLIPDFIKVSTFFLSTISSLISFIEKNVFPNNAH